MELFLPGNRVVLISHGDADSPLRLGTRGTVVTTDALGTVHVRWDDGSSLGVAPDLGDELRHLTPLERDQERGFGAT